MKKFNKNLFFLVIFFGLLIIPFSCQKEKDIFNQVFSNGEINTEKRTNDAACGDESTEGCEEKTISTSFFYEDCEYFVATTYFICPTKIIMNPLISARGISGPCRELQREETNLYITPNVGDELLSNFKKTILTNLSNQMRNHIITELDPMFIGNFRCTENNPCSNPTTSKTFVGLTKDCFKYCVESWEEDPDFPEEMLVNLTREQCGTGGCCKTTTPFCIHATTGAGCYGTTVTTLITECTELFIQPCENEYCPTVCNN